MKRKMKPKMKMMPKTKIMPKMNLKENMEVASRVKYKVVSGFLDGYGGI